MRLSARDQALAMLLDLDGGVPPIKDVPVYDGLVAEGLAVSEEWDGGRRIYFPTLKAMGAVPIEIEVAQLSAETLEWLEVAA